MTLLQTGLDHKVGEIDTYQYGANFSILNIGTRIILRLLLFLIPSSDPIYLFHVETDAVYDSYDDQAENRFGWLLMAMGALAFCLGLFRL